jgi:hypothetical protein
VEQFGRDLGQTAEMVNSLCQRLLDFQQLGQAEQESLTGESVLSRKKLSELETAIPALIRHITQQQTAFAQSAEDLLALVQFPLAVAETSSRSLGFFNDLVAWGGDGGSCTTGESAASRKIDLLKSRYTMASERHAHTAVLQPVPTLAEATTPLASVELFDELESLPAEAVEVPGEGAPQDNLSGGQPPPFSSSAGETAAPKPVAPDLGDNVELF